MIWKMIILKKIKSWEIARTRNLKAKRTQKSFKNSDYKYRERDYIIL